MTIVNGKIPLSYLDRAYRSTLYLAPGCNSAWKDFATEVYNRTGIWPKISSPDGAYRSYARQVYWYQHYLTYGSPVAAYPGTSNHGLGMAIDIYNYRSFSHTFLVEIGKKHGFIYDTASERWHMKFTGLPRYNTNIVIGKDMMYPFVITDVKGTPKYLFDAGKSQFLPVPEGHGGQIEAAFGKFTKISQSTMNLIIDMVK